MMKGGLLVGSVLLSQGSYSLKLLGTWVLVGIANDYKIINITIIALCILM
jgi:hypothetical protein